eukprot:Mrub_04481.p1 GENE.Mrub_04481~~Mrub_04481.p1  ORF type:complete len:406 (-),score=43.38 Mrub_04481:48-1142(-)
MHLSPEAEHMYTKAGYSHYPYNGLITIIGYVMMVNVDYYFGGCCAHDSDHQANSCANDSHSHSEDNVNTQLINKDLDRYKDKDGIASIDSNKKVSKTESKSNNNYVHHHNHLHSQVEKGDYMRITNESGIISDSNANAYINNNNLSIEISKNNKHSIDYTSKITSSVSLGVGLSVHNILEGISIGLTPDADKLIAVSMGIGVHKIIDSFFLGMLIMKSNYSQTKSYLFMSLFCLTGPLGLMVGFIVQANISTIVQAVLTSFTVGTFLYISLTEIASHEFGNNQNRQYKMAGFIVGIICFALFMYFNEHDCCCTQIQENINEKIKYKPNFNYFNQNKCEDNCLDCVTKYKPIRTKRQIDPYQMID